MAGATHFRGGAGALCGDTKATSFTQSTAAVTCLKCKNALAASGGSTAPYLRTN